MWLQKKGKKSPAKAWANEWENFDVNRMIKWSTNYLWPLLTRRWILSFTEQCQCIIMDTWTKWTFIYFTRQYATQHVTLNTRIVSLLLIRWNNKACKEMIIIVHFVLLKSIRIEAHHLFNSIDCSCVHTINECTAFVRIYVQATFKLNSKSNQNTMHSVHIGICSVW